MIRDPTRGPAVIAPRLSPFIPLPRVTPSDASKAHTPGELPTHFSYSAMSTFQDCPRKWAYLYLHDAPREFVGASLLMGGSLHVAVECLHHDRLAGRAPDTAAALAPPACRYTCSPPISRQPVCR